MEEENNDYAAQIDSSPIEQNEELEANLTAQVAEIVDEDRKELSIKETKTQQAASKHEETKAKSQTTEAPLGNQTQPQMMPQMNMGMMPGMGGQMQMPMM